MALNLRLRTEAAWELGVETHVCEIQLILRPFAEIKVFFARAYLHQTLRSRTALCILTVALKTHLDETHAHAHIHPTVISKSLKDGTTISGSMRRISRAVTQPAFSEMLM